MRFPSSVCPTASVAFFVLGLVAIGPAFCLADDGDAKYKQGDRVEVESFGEWQSGVVVGIDDRFDRIEVRLDDDKDLPKNIPARAREAFLTRKVRPEDLRRLKDAAPAKPLPPQKERTWKDRSGKFSITAKFKETRGETVVLERADGKTVEILLGKLSDDDGTFVRGLTGSENPFTVPGEAAGGNATRSGSAAVANRATDSATTVEPDALPELKPLKPNWREVRLVRAKTFSTWSFKPESKASPLDPKLNSPRVVLEDIPRSDKFFEKAELHVSDDGRRAIVARAQGAVGRNSRQYVQDVDLVTGKASGLIALPKETTVLDAWPAERLVIFGPERFGSRNDGVLTIARLEQDKLVPVTSWTPFGNEERGASNTVDQAWFLGPSRVLTGGSLNTALTVWEVGTAKALMNIPLEHGVQLRTAMSRDRRILAILMSAGIALIDLEAGSHVATVAMEPLSREEQFHFGSLAFRDDMQRLAAASDKGVTTWDLTTGQKLNDFWHPTMTRPTTADFAGEFLFVKDQYLFDAPRRVLLWEYGKSGRWSFRGKHLHGGRIWAVTDTDDKLPAALVSARLPHSEALQLAGELGTADDFILAKPGDSVAIKIEVDPGVAAAEEIRAAIAANLEQAGFRVAEQADLLVTATCKQKDAQTIKINTSRTKSAIGFHPFSRPRPEDIVERTITPHVSFLMVTFRAQKIWEDGYLAQPGQTIYLKENESLDEALVRLTSPNVDLLKKTRFPSHITRPGTASENGAYGASGFMWDN